MARCQTCGERFDQKYIGQKNCDGSDECKEAERELKNEKIRKYQEKYKQRQKNRPQGVLKVVNNLSPEAVRRLRKAFKETHGPGKKLVVVNQKPLAAKKSRPKQVSQKQAAIEREYHKMLEIFDLNTEKKCSGCGRWQGGDIALSHSHIISRADCKRIGRPDLIADDRNVVYHCLDLGEHVGCHRKHEARDKSLLDWQEKLEFVKGICEEVGDMTLYNKLIMK